MNRMNRHRHYNQVLRMRGGAFTANQQKLIDAQPTEELKNARRRQFESYNQNLKETEEQIARGEIPPVWKDIAEQNKRREEEAAKMEQAYRSAGGYDKYYYGNNAPIMFEPDDPDAPTNTSGSKAVSARRNIRDNNWEVVFADGSKEYIFSGDERYALPEAGLYASNPLEFIERVAQQADSIRERQRQRFESMSATDKFFSKVNDTLSNIADIGTNFAPGLASTAYETFRPGTRAERNEREIQGFIDRSLQTQSAAEKSYEQFRTGRFRKLLDYDPELKQRIQNYDTLGNSVQQTLRQMQGD